MTQNTTPPPASDSQPRWHDWASRTTAILAVLAALSSGRWGASNLQAILEQGKVNDSWAYYQSKSIKEHEAKQMRSLVAVLATGQSADREAYRKLEKQFAEEGKHEEDDKKQREIEARNYETSRNAMVARGFWFEVSFSCLQLGVILCTIATGAKSKSSWFAGMGLGVLGLLGLINGFYPVVPAPPMLYRDSIQAMSTHPAPPGTVATQPGE